MATSTSSFFYNKINVSYPQAGKDNDSQTFRNNFTNVKNALKATDDLVNELKLGLVTTNDDNDFNFNTIRRANLQNCSVSVLDDTTNVRSGAMTIDYRQGTYQRFRVNSGFTNFQIINWPTGPAGEKLGGRLVISVEPYSSNLTQIDFTGETSTTVIPVDRLSSYYEFVSKQTVFFEIWSDDSGSTMYVKELGYKSAITTTGTNIVALDSLTIGSNKYSTGSNFSTVVYTNTGTNPKIGRVALIRDTYATTILDTGGVPGNNTTTFYVSAADRILPGATFTLPISSSTVYTVSSLTTGTTIVADPAFPVENLFFQSEVVFLNPGYLEQPSIVTFKDSAQTTSTGVAGDLKGTIYATSSSLYVAYEDYGTNAENWLEINKGTASVYDKSNNLANTEFVHNVLPYGSIIMWYGAISNVPSGWNLCDGTNGTPDLRNRFIVGAGNTYSVAATGGSTDAIVVSHAHSATFIGNELPTHRHSFSGAVPPGGGGGTGGGDLNVSSGSSNTTDVSGGTPSGTVTVASTGTSGTNANLPPYYALAYIMKITGN